MLDGVCYGTARLHRRGTSSAFRLSPPPSYLACPDTWKGTQSFSAFRRRKWFSPSWLRKVQTSESFSYSTSSCIGSTAWCFPPWVFHVSGDFRKKPALVLNTVMGCCHVVFDEAMVSHTLTCAGSLPYRRLSVKACDDRGGLGRHQEWYMRYVR